MTGLLAGPHRRYSYFDRGLGGILIETPQRFERVSQMFWTSESRYCAIRWAVMAASVDVIGRFDVSYISVLASAPGDSGRCRIHARRKRRDSLLEEKYFCSDIFTLTDDGW
jgi:hypothetical protein